MKSRVYIETSVISYMTARPSRDPILAACQRYSIDWWSARRPDFDVFVSQVVLREARRGDADAVNQRLAVLAGIPVLAVDTAAIALGQALVRQHALPARAADDALHLAVAAVQGLDYLLTWNCKHLANAELLKTMGNVIRSSGYDAPWVCTPAELMGVEP